MNTYKPRVRVHSPSGASVTTVWEQVAASNTIHTQQLLESQYGCGNVSTEPGQLQFTSKERFDSQHDLWVLALGLSGTEL